MQLRPLQGKKPKRILTLVTTCRLARKQVFTALLAKIADIYTENPGKINLVKHKIQTVTDDAVNVKSDPLPKAVKNEVKAVMVAGIIEPWPKTKSKIISRPVWALYQVFS